VKFRRVVSIACFVVIMFVIGSAGIATMQSTQGAQWPVLHPKGSADPADVAEIQKVIERSYDVTGQAARDFDVRDFPDVFANDPTVPLSDEQAEGLNRIRAAHPGMAQGSGWLDYQLAAFGSWKIGAEGLERLEAQAKAQGRRITKEELLAISGPTGPPAGRRTDPLRKTSVRFDNIAVDGQRAEVVCDDGNVQWKRALLKTKNGWRIVGERALLIHGA
jgi:hypothetical protein